MPQDNNMTVCIQMTGCQLLPAINEFYATHEGMLSSAKWHAAADDRSSDCSKVVSG